MDTVEELWESMSEKHGNDLKTLWWPHKERQELTFKGFINNVDLNNKKIVDIGCGFGDFYKYLTNQNIKVEYTGIDISKKIVSSAKEKYPEISEKIHLIDFLSDDYIIDNIDYFIICGTFNCNHGDNWNFINKILDKAYKLCVKGVIFNLISTYVDYKEDYLYYVDPAKIIQFCKQYTPYINIINDYHKYEYITVMYKKS